MSEANDGTEHDRSTHDSLVGIVRERGPLTTREIARAVDAGERSVEQRLRVLEADDASPIRARRVGRWFLWEAVD